MSAPHGSTTTQQSGPTARRGIAVVTGASGGIGRATVLRLAGAGYDVVAHHRTRTAEAERLRDDVRATGRECWLVRADLGTTDGTRLVIDAVDAVRRDHPDRPLVALVNNAAQLLGPSFGAATPDDFDAYFAVNTRAPFFLTQALARWMPVGGAVVNVSSAGVHFASPGDIVYAMSKAAVESFTRHAAVALAPAGIRVNAVVPGFTDNGHVAFRDPDVLAHMSTHAVLGGVSDPATVAEAIVFLLSDAAARTTGAVLDVSGGSTLGARPPAAASVSLRDVAARGR